MPSSIESVLSSTERPSLKKSLSLVWSLSVPVILSQIASVLMQYIDAAMVGRLGASASASISVVSTSMWLVYGLSLAACCGFSVQVSQLVGSGDDKKTRQTVREALISVFAFSIFVCAICAAMSFYIPKILGAEKRLWADSSSYFFVFSVFLPFMMVERLCVHLLQASGCMKVSGALSVFLCVLDVVFNALFIYGLNLGVKGAALGTAASEVVVCFFALYLVCFKSKKLALKKGGKWNLSSPCIKTAFRIGLPVAFQEVFFDTAYILGTKIIAPLGTVSLAANSFGITAEALCYMPGYGIAQAASTLVGQCVGAGRKDLSKRFSWLSVFLGLCVMSLTAVLMFFACPYVFAFFTQDPQVQALGVRVLRIEVFAEPFFAASIICSGALRGAGDTLVPAILNLFSMWGVRLSLMLILCKNYGLTGAWIAMAAELCVRGILLLLRLRAQKWDSIKMAVS